jgi:putative Mn2+ efflux pump MntP
MLMALVVGIDVFAGGLAYGVSGLPRERWIRVAAVFAVAGLALMTAGLLFGEALERAFGNAVSYVAGAGLLAIGLTFVWEVVSGDEREEIEALDRSPEAQRPLLLTAVMVSADKLAIGISLALADLPLSAVMVYVAGLGFGATLAGLSAGARLGARVGAAAHGVAGVVFVLLGAVIVFKAAAGGSTY